MQGENRAAEGKTRLKCEQQKERRDEKETIMWMNHGLRQLENLNRLGAAAADSESAQSQDRDS